MRGISSVLVVVVVGLLGGCHHPGVRGMGNQLALMKNRLVAGVASGAVKIDVAKAAQAAAQVPPPQQRVEEPPPVQQRDPDPQRQSQVTQTPPPDMHVTRVNAAHPTVFVLRGRTHGGKDFCEVHATIDECNSACTSMLRMHMMSKPDASTPTGCTCNEEDRGC